MQCGQLLFQSTDRVANFGQSFESHQLSSRFSGGAGWCSKVGLAPRHIAVDAGFCTDDRRVADMYMVGDPNLSGTDDIVSGGYRACETDLRDQQVVTTDVAVVSDHDLIVDSGAGPNHSFTDFGAIDCCAGTDFDVITDTNNTKVGQSLMSAVDHSVAEAVGSYDAAGMNNHVIADPDVGVEDGSGVQNDVIADYAAVTDDSPWVDIAAVANHHICSDDGLWVDIGVSTDFC